MLLIEYILGAGALALLIYIGHIIFSMMLPVPEK
jgi:hypothetical protein